MWPVCAASQELRLGAGLLPVLLSWVPAPQSFLRSTPPAPPPVLTSVPHAAARVGLMHIGVFILLLLSGERNFGVRLNKPYSVRVPMDIPVFTGTHADLLIVVRGLPPPGPGGMGGILLAESGGRGDLTATPLPPGVGVPQDHHQRSPAAAAPVRLPAHHRGQR